MNIREYISEVLSLTCSEDVKNWLMCGSVSDRTCVSILVAESRERIESTKYAEDMEAIKAAIEDMAITVAIFVVENKPISLARARDKFVKFCESVMLSGVVEI